MDYESYKKAYFTDPQPEPRFDFIGLHGVALYFNDYKAAVEYYTSVLGPPAYVEGEDTRGWMVGTIWLTLFPSKSDDPHNAEIHFLMSSTEEAERLQRAFIEAGGSGEYPSDQLMYEPLRYCPVRDPFGTSILVLSRLPQE